MPLGDLLIFPPEQCLCSFGGGQLEEQAVLQAEQLCSSLCVLGLGKPFHFPRPPYTFPQGEEYIVFYELW